MRPATRSQSLPYSQPLPSSNTNSQTFTYDLPNDEPDLNSHPWDPNYSYTTPEGTGCKVKLPADTSSVSTQTSGKRTTFFLYLHSFFYLTVLRNRQIILILFCFQASVPPLPPRPSFLQSMPEYLVLLPAPYLSRSSSKELLSDTSLISSSSKGNLQQSLSLCQKNNTFCYVFTPPVIVFNALAAPCSGSADQGPLPGNPNVLLVSLGKLLSEESQ